LFYFLNFICSYISSDFALHRGSIALYFTSNRVSEMSEYFSYVQKVPNYSAVKLIF